jgi:hypothetical protein
MKKLLVTLAALVAALTLFLTPAMAKGKHAASTATATATATATSTSTDAGNSATAPKAVGEWDIWCVLSVTGLWAILYILWGWRIGSREERSLRPRIVVSIALAFLLTGILRHLKLHSLGTSLSLLGLALVLEAFIGHRHGLRKAMRNRHRVVSDDDLDYCAKCGHLTTGESHCAKCGKERRFVRLEFLR